MDTGELGTRGRTAQQLEGQPGSQRVSADATSEVSDQR